MKRDWKGKKIGILGLGIEGVSTAAYLHAKGAEVTILDYKEESAIDKTLLAGVKKLAVPLVLGPSYVDNLDGFSLLVRSPGIPISTPHLQEVKQKGIEITSQTKLFFEACPCPIIGVTGTKGKGTTSTLIYEMLRRQGFTAYLGGNIGLPPLTFLDTLDEHSKVVLELSSFQLQDLTQSPHIAVMLMVTSEHLDYHKDTYEYVDAKRNILRFQTNTDFAILNRDYPASHESDVYTEGKIYQVSRERGTDEGCYAIGPKIFISKGGSVSEVMDQKDVLLPGEHNLENVCAAIMAANLAGVQIKHIVDVLKTFKGLEHRLELVKEVNGVRYYDDSFSTTPETAIAAIRAFTVPEVLILGGSTKNSDFSELGKTIREAKNIKAIIGIGEEWVRIKEAIGEPNQPMLFIEDSKSMQDAVLAASKLASEGNVVLLSPACASFGMFKNYKERGEQFKKEVNTLSQ